MAAVLAAVGLIGIGCAAVVVPSVERGAVVLADDTPTGYDHGWNTNRGW